MTKFEEILIFAIKAHKGQKDLQKEPYILHPLYVMSKMDTEEERIVAMLHDVTEDCAISLEKLSEYFKLSEEISKALFLLDKNNFNNYEEMIKEIKKDKLATKVKLADLEHNMKLDRIKNKDNLKEKDLKRLKKYICAWNYLKEDVQN